MAKVIEWTAEQRANWDQWVASRPDIVRELATKFPGDRLYRIKKSGDRGTIASYSENGTMTLIVDGTYCRVLFGKNVFGLHPDDIEECDLPGPDEQLGDFASESEENRRYVDEEFIPAMRAKIQAERN
jgi:hypothetical protein